MTLVLNEGWAFFWRVRSPQNRGQTAPKYIMVGLQLSEAIVEVFGENVMVAVMGEELQNMKVMRLAKHQTATYLLMQ